MDDDGFTTVQRTGRGRAYRPFQKPSKTKPSPQILYNTPTSLGSRRGDTALEEKLNKVLVILETRKRQLEDKAGSGGKGKEKSFVDSWMDQITSVRRIFQGDLDGAASSARSSRPMRIVCLGIGIVHESRESQFQFLLLDMLKEDLQVPAEEVWVYDPLFTPIEVALLEKREYQLISKNECGKHKLDWSHNTLVYMPHCPGKLYDAFIRENWDKELLGGSGASLVSPTELEGKDVKPEDISKVVLLANNFRGYIDNLPQSRVEQELPSLSRLTPYLSTIVFPALSPSHIASNAFNSLLFQYVSAEESKKVDWDVVPPEGSKQGGAAQTEIIENEIKEAKEIQQEGERGEKLPAEKGIEAVERSLGSLRLS